MKGINLFKRLVRDTFKAAMSKRHPAASVKIDTNTSPSGVVTLTARRKGQPFDSIVVSLSEVSTIDDLVVAVERRTNWLTV